MTPSTTATDIASYSVTGLPPGLGIDRDGRDQRHAGHGRRVTVTDTAGNPATVSIAFPAVARGNQTLTGFAYSSATATYGDTAPTVTAPSGVQTTLSYSATPATVCTVDSSTGALSLKGVGSCEITATATGPGHVLALDTIAGDAEKAAGFTIPRRRGCRCGDGLTAPDGDLVHGLHHRPSWR